MHKIVHKRRVRPAELGCALAALWAFAPSQAIAQAAEEDAPQQSTETISAEDAPEEGGDTVVVEADPLANSYTETDPITSERAPTSIIEAGRRTDVVTKPVMRDLAAVDTEEIFRIVPNLTVGESGSFNLRGFGSGRGAIYFNGVRNSPYNHIPPFLVNVERVEVLKGPAGVMYGTGEPGGFINMVLEKPQADGRHEFMAYFGSHGKQRVEIDSTDAITEDGKLLYRLNVAFEDSETFRANGEMNNSMATLALTWKPLPALKFELQSMAIEDERNGGRGYGYPVLHDDLYFLPRETSINEPTDIRRNQIFWAALDTTVTFSDAWQAVLTTYASNSTYANRYHEGRRGSEDLNERLLQRQWRDQSVETSTLGYDLRLIGEFDAGPTHHRVLVGHDLHVLKNPEFPAIRARISNPASDALPNGAAPIDLLAPDYGAAAEETYTLTADNETTADRLNYSGYGSWRGTFFDDLHTMVGLRYDLYDETTDTTNYLTNETSGTSDDSTALTFQGGLVYELLSDQLSIFATYAGGFKEQSWFSRNNPNGPFDPFEFDQYEAGVQAHFLRKRLVATVTGFRIDRRNELTADPDPAAPSGAQVSEGSTRSEGLEVTLAGRPLPRWDVTGQFGYNHAYVLESNFDNEGDPAAGSPRLTGGLWVGHDLANIPLRLFGGFVSVGERPSHSDKSNPLYIDLPGYTVLDVGGRFNVGGWSAQVNFNNILDKEYFTAYRPPAHSVAPGTPRSLRVTLSATF